MAEARSRTPVVVAGGGSKCSPCFDIRALDFFRHWSFDIRHSQNPVLTRRKT